MSTVYITQGTGYEITYRIDDSEPRSDCSRFNRITVRRTIDGKYMIGQITLHNGQIDVCPEVYDTEKEATSKMFNCWMSVRCR